MNTSVTTSKEISLPCGSLAAYIQWANKIPLLSQEEERFLANDFRNNGNLESARRLVMSHLRLVISIARNYINYGLPYADLIQEGNIGLMKAVKRFDPSVGVRLVSFAIQWIKSEIYEFIICNRRMAKIATTKAHRTVLFNLRKFLSDKTKSLSEQDAQLIAKKLNVSVNDVRTMEERLNTVDEPLENFDNDTDTDWKSPINYLEDQRFNPAIEVEIADLTSDQNIRLKLALAKLDERSRQIIHKRWLANKKATLHDLAKEYSVSAERIRQLESKAMKNLKKELDGVILD